MSDTITVRLRGTAFHHGKRLRPGEQVEFNTEDLIEGRLPSWAETIPGVTDMAILAKYINAGDARQIASNMRRTAERESKIAQEAKVKADGVAKQASEAEKMATDAEKVNKAK